MGVPLLKGASSGGEIPRYDQTARSTGGGAEKVVDLGNVSGSITLDLSLGSVFKCVPTAAITAVNFSNVPASGLNCVVTLRVAQGGTAFSVATPTGGIFLGAPTPTQVANKVCKFLYESTDAGTVWDCSASVQV